MTCGCFIMICTNRTKASRGIVLDKLMRLNRELKEKRLLYKLHDKMILQMTTPGHMSYNRRKTTWERPIPTRCIHETLPLPIITCYFVVPFNGTWPGRAALSFQKIGLFLYSLKIGVVFPTWNSILLPEKWKKVVAHEGQYFEWIKERNCILQEYRIFTKCFMFQSVCIILRYAFRNLFKLYIILITL